MNPCHHARCWPALLALSGSIYALRLVYIAAGIAGSDGFA